MATQSNLQSGAKFTTLPELMDVQTATLRDVIKAYEKASGSKGWSSTFTGKGQVAEIFKPYLDEPAVNFIDSFSDDKTNPLIKAFDTTDKVGSRRTIHSKFRAIEFTLQDQLKRQGSLTQLFPQGMPLASDRVINPDKPLAKSARYTFNPGKLGEFQVALENYAKANPKDIGVVNALFAQMHLGLRPGEIANAPASALRRPEGKLSKSWGFYLDTDTPGVKMDNNLNIAIGPRTYHYMQQGLSAGGQNLFVNPDGSPITTGDMTRVIKQIKVPGIMEDMQEGVKLDALQEAYDLRRMHATTAYTLFPGQGNKVAAARGRAVGAVLKEAGAEKDYVALSPGFYAEASTDVPFAMDAWLFQEARALELGVDVPEGQRLSYNTDFISGNAVFEDENSPIKIGDLNARYVEPSKKIKIEAVAPEKPVSQADIQAGFEEAEKSKTYPSPLDIDDLQNAGIEVNQPSGKKILSAAPFVAFGGLTVAGVLADPAQAAIDIGLEAGALAMKAPAGLAAAVPTALAAKPAGEGSDIVPDAPPLEGPYAGQDFIPAQEEPVDEGLDVIRRDVEMGEVDTVPEAPTPSPQENQGFLSPTL
jgi:hypothetical protein